MSRSAIRVIGLIVLTILGTLPNLFGTQVILWVLSMALFLGSFPLLLRWTRVGGLGELGFALHGRWKGQFSAGIAFGALMFAGVLAARLGLGQYRFDSVAPLGAAIRSVLLLLPATLYGAFYDELIFRGYLFRILPDRWGAWARMLAGGLIFSAGHWHRWGAPPQEWVHLFLLGLLFSIPVLLLRSIWFSFGLHWGQNLAIFLLMEGDLAILRMTDGPGVHPIGTYAGTLAVLLCIPLVWLIGRLLRPGSERPPHQMGA